MPRRTFHRDAIGGTNITVLAACRLHAKLAIEARQRLTQLLDFIVLSAQSLDSLAAFYYRLGRPLNCGAQRLAGSLGLRRQQFSYRFEAQD